MKHALQKKISIIGPVNEAKHESTLTAPTVMLTLQSMGTRSLRTAISLLILSGCAAAVPELKPPPEGLAWSPEAPFRNQRKTEIPSEAASLQSFPQRPCCCSAKATSIRR